MSFLPGSSRVYDFVVVLVGCSEMKNSVLISLRHVLL